MAIYPTASCAHPRALFYSGRVEDEHGRGVDEGGAVESGAVEGGAREAGQGVPLETPPSLEATTPRVSKDTARGRRRLALVIALIFAGAAAGVLYLGYNARLRARLSEQAGKVRDVITGAPAPDPYAEAVLKVEEDRGEAIGRKAQTEVPSELKHYAESKRFLAVQEASAREAGLKSPHDFAELAEWVRDGALTEAPRLGDGYVLYGVGLAATGALTHYDAARGRSVPLFADDAGLKSYTDGLDAQRTQLEGELKDLNERLKALDKKDRQGRAQVNAEAKAKRKEVAGVEESIKSLKLYYATPKQRDALFAEYGVLASLARDFGGRAYDLNDTASAKEFQARLLTFVRPAALEAIRQLGSAYQEKFGRPLPVTSLIRTEEYQRTLREAGNANAGSFKSEPHTTGLAFDVYYHFMTAAEQQFVMDSIAQLKREGRVEALRELRDHYHVFAFPGGVKPDDEFVDKILKGGARDTDDDSKAKAKTKTDARQTKDSKEKAKEKTKARSKKTTSAPAPARVKKGARRR